MSEKIYKYYTIIRPPDIGAVPPDFIDIKSYDILKQVLKDGTMAWGEVTYNRKLTDKEVRDYELLEAILEEKKLEALKDIKSLDQIYVMILKADIVDNDLQCLMDRMSDLINKEIKNKIIKNNISHQEYQENVNKSLLVELDKDEAIRYYADKIVYDCLTDCSENNRCFSVDEYKNNDFIVENFDKIVEKINQDERVCDLEVDSKKKELDFIFYLEYCPHCYQENLDISNTERYVYVKDFESYVFDWSVSVPKHKFRTTTREMIRGFIDNRFPEHIDIVEDILKKELYESGFVDKYINGYTVPVNSENINDMLECLDNSIKKLRLTLESGEIENG